MAHGWTRRLVALVVTALIGGALVGSPASPVSALTGASFDPGNIISDANFYSTNAMTESEIQAFLDAKIGTCLNTNCLNIKRTTTTTRSSDAMCSGYVGAPDELASRIVFKVQQSCGISAKVLLVTLQKEQGLVTATSPSDSRLDRAMGYACPDDPARPGWCDPAYAGLYNQIFRAAWQFKRYGNPPGTSLHFTWFPVGGIANILFHPNSTTCGSSPVQLRNAATAALYYYTPYQPNEAALSNLGGTGDACSSYGNRNFWVYYSHWFGSPTGPSLSPTGNWEVASTTINSAIFRGWAFDPETAEPIDVHLYVNGNWGGAFSANLPRTDIAAAYPSYGPLHGFEFSVPIGIGTFEACLYAINRGTEGGNSSLGCRVLSTPVGPPFGNIESIAAVPFGASIRGWAIDRDTTEPAAVKAYVNGTLARDGVANGSRPDVSDAYPGYGPLHGFDVQVPLLGGTSQVCLTAVNVGVGNSTSLGCRLVTLPGGPPTGNLEAASSGIGVANLSGWALDLDSPESIDLHVYVNGQWGGSFRADTTRPDVASYYPSYGSSHGFALSIPVSGGSNSVCVYGINVGSGYNQAVGCRTISSPGGPPFGNIDSSTLTAGVRSLSGWAIDPDSVSSIQLHAYVDGQWGGIYEAASYRPDVGQAYGGYGDSHGFQVTIPVANPGSRVCVYAINVGAGYNRLVGCSA